MTSSKATRIHNSANLIHHSKEEHEDSLNVKRTNSLKLLEKFPSLGMSGNFYTKKLILDVKQPSDFKEKEPN